MRLLSGCGFLRPRLLLLLLLLRGGRRWTGLRAGDVACPGTPGAPQRLRAGDEVMGGWGRERRSG